MYENKKINTILLNGITRIGYYGPIILLGVIIFFITFPRMILPVSIPITVIPLIYVYIVLWQMISHLLNVIIKNTLKAPRPDSKLEELKSINPCLKNYLTIHRQYGMPSGHAQSVCSQLVFLALFFNNQILTILAAGQTVITLWQRYYDERHSLKQLLVGSMIGIGMGYIFYKIIMTLFSSKDIKSSIESP